MSGRGRRELRILDWMDVKSSECASVQRKSLTELLDTPDPAWPLVQGWIRESVVDVEVLSPDLKNRESHLEALQISVRSPMGAIVYETGGLLIDHGFLRVLGCGNARLPRSLPEWNERCRSDGFFLIADDIVGGFFAGDSGAFGTKMGSVHYFAPDTLRWEPLNGMGYSAFLQWCLSDKLETFYASMRWPDWEDECASINGDQALSIWPPMWSKEGKEISKNSRKPAPIREVYELNVIEYPRQLNSSQE
jgi:hypothetical protein